MLASVKFFIFWFNNLGIMSSISESTSDRKSNGNFSRQLLIVDRYSLISNKSNLIGRKLERDLKNDTKQNMKKSNAQSIRLSAGQLFTKNKCSAFL